MRQLSMNKRPNDTKNNRPRNHKCKAVDFWLTVVSLAIIPHILHSLSVPMYMQ